MSSRVNCGLAAALVAAATAVPASGAGPRQTYTDRFTTDVPGASAGRTAAIDWIDPENPGGKPHALSHVHLELAEGSRFDTSAVPFCRASDAELMLAGDGACPAESKVGTDEILLDTGFPEPGRHLTADITFFNDDHELILLSTVRENGLRVVLRGTIGENTLDIPVPLLPGTPPEGAGPVRERFSFEPRSTVRDGVRVNYLTTPPGCPAGGSWVNRVTYTYRDGVEQTSESRSPCTPPDSAAPAISASGIPTACAARGFRAQIAIADASPLRAVRVRLDGRRVAAARRSRVSVRVPVARLRAGRHTLRVAAVDAAGNRAVRFFRFRRC